MLIPAIKLILTGIHTIPRYRHSPKFWIKSIFSLVRTGTCARNIQLIAKSTA